MTRFHHMSRDKRSTIFRAKEDTSAEIRLLKEPCSGVSQPTAILNAEKVLETKLLLSPSCLLQFTQKR